MVRPHKALRPRRRPRPRESWLVGMRAGIAAVCLFRIAPRVRWVGDAEGAVEQSVSKPNASGGT